MTRNLTGHFVIFHGTGANPGANWLPWLAGRLQAEGFAVSVPRFPSPGGQSLESWTKAFYSQVAPLHPDMVLIGHSMGVGMILRLLEKASNRVRGCLLVSGWTGLLGNPDFDPLIESFFVDDFDWPAIRERGGVVRLFHGEDDPYVPPKLAGNLAKQLNGPLTLIPGGGHLNTESGYTHFPQLLEAALSFSARKDPEAIGS